MTLRSTKDISAVLESGAVERAARAAFFDAVRLYRQANLPLVMWKDGKVDLVSPFDVTLPEEEENPPSK